MEAALVEFVRASPEASRAFAWSNGEKFGIAPEARGEFWARYCALVDAGSKALGIYEQVPDACGVIAELTLKFSAKEYLEDQELYDQANLPAALVYFYQRALLNLTDAKDVTCFVLESSKPWVTGNIVSCGVRIQFPFCRVPVSFQNGELRTAVEGKLRNIGKYAKLPFLGSTLHPLQDIVPLLGTSRQGQSHYIFSLCLGIIPENFEDEYLTEAEMPRLSVEYHPHVNELTGILKEYNDSYWLPIMLSVQNNHPLTTVRPKAPVIRSGLPIDPDRMDDHAYWQRIGQSLHQMTGGENEGLRLWIENTKDFSTRYGESDCIRGYPLFGEKKGSVELETPEAIAMYFMSLLSETRKEGMYWMDVGRSLYSVYKGKEQGLDAWRTWSNLGQREACATHYHQFHETGITIKTLGWYAREDSPIKYADWHRKWCEAACLRALSGLHSDVAEALYRCYWLDFISTTDNKRAEWYQFDGTIWQYINDGINLRVKISDDSGFLRHFDIIRAEKTQKAVDHADIRDSIESTLKAITSLFCKLKSHPFKRALMKEAFDLFHYPKFVSKLDANPELMAFRGVVLEIYDNKANPRPGKPEDYLQHQANARYNPSMTHDHPMVKLLEKWIRQVYYDPELIHHFYMVSTSFLRGGNSDKHMYIFSGKKGNNSKSTIIKLYESTLGQYAFKLPWAYYSQKRGHSSSATPEIVRGCSARLGITQEPNRRDTWGDGVVKEATGGDKMYVRALYGAGMDMDILFKCLLVCNSVPSFTSADQATQNRVDIIPHDSEWVDNAPESEEEQFRQRKFKADRYFDRQVPKFADAFLWLLVEAFPQYARDGIRKPVQVKAANQAFWSSNDIYGNFIKEALTYHAISNGTADRGYSVRASELQTSFRKWYSVNCSGAPPDATESHEYFDAKLGPRIDDVWYGYELKSGNTQDH